MFRLGGTAEIGAEVDHGGGVVPGRPGSVAGCATGAGDGWLRPRYG
jgi:hypothetical protein